MNLKKYLCNDYLFLIDQNIDLYKNEHKEYYLLGIIVLILISF